MTAYLAALATSLETAVLITAVLFGLVITTTIIKHGLLSAPAVLILVIGLFHLGLVVPYVLLPLPEPEVSLRWLQSAQTLPAVALVALGLASFQAGTDLVRDPRDLPTQLLGDEAPDRFMSHLWVLSTIFFATCYLYLGLHYGILFAPRAHYIHLKATGEAPLFGTARLLMILSGFVAASFAPKKYAPVIGGLVLLFLLPMFISGKRGEFVTTAIAFVVLFHKRRIRLQPLVFAVFGLMFVLLAPLLRNVRGGFESFGPWYLDPLYEMGQQLRTVVYTVEVVDGGRSGLWLGQSYLDALWRVIPNIADIRGGWIGGLRVESPSFWLTEIYRPGGAGLGYSIIAEPFLNFGVVGVLLGMLLIGAGIRWMEVRARAMPHMLAVFGVVLAALLWSVRNDFYGVFRPMAWILVGLYVTRFIGSVLRRRVPPSV